MLQSVFKQKLFKEGGIFQGEKILFVSNSKLSLITINNTRKTNSCVAVVISVWWKNIKTSWKETANTRVALRVR